MFYCDPNNAFCYADPLEDEMTIDTNAANGLAATTLLPEDVPLRGGPPTREELLVHYPAKFTWTQLKTFVNSGYATLSIS